MRMLFVLVLACVFVVPGCAQTRESPPSIVYGSTRTSRQWIETPIGNLAVDDGVAWKGVRVYLALSMHLVATDERNGKLLWTAPCSAFWNEIGFREVETPRDGKTWAVELRPARRSGEGSDRRQLHDLTTGRVIPGPADEPSGNALAVEPQWAGGWSARAKPFSRLVGSADDWRASVLEGMFAGVAKAPGFGAIDFGKNVVLVVSDGDRWNSDGFDAKAWEDENRILVRLREHTFQTSGPGGGGQERRPFGIFVLPRSDPFKPIIVERNAQNLIGGPAIWKQLCRFDGPGEPSPESRPAGQRKQRAGR